MRNLVFEKVVNEQRLGAEIAAAVGHVLSGGKYGGMSSGEHPCIIHIADDTSPAQETTIAGIVDAHVATPPSTPLLTYANAFLQNRALIFQAFKTYDSGIRAFSASPTTTEKRAMLTALDAIIQTLPVDFKIRIERERVLFGLPAAPPSGWGDAACNGWIQYFNSWFGQALGGIGCALAGEIKGSLD
jgi:hypothetical protein